MTGIQVNKALELELDKIYNGSAPAFTEEEKNYFLNKAANQLIVRKFTGNNTLKAGFEANMKRIGDLMPYVVETVYEEPNNSTSPYEYTCEVGTKYEDILIPIAGSLFIDSTYEPITFIKIEQLPKFTVSSNNVPWIENPVAAFMSNTILVCIDPIKYLNYTGQAPLVVLKYIREPNAIDVSSELNIEPYTQSFLYETISLAAMLMLENIESSRTQSYAQLTTQYSE